MERFWDLTLDEIAIERDGAQQRLDRLYEVALFGAWYTEYFARVKRLPSLKSMLDKMKPQPPASPEVKRQGWMLHREWMKARSELQASELKKHPMARRRKSR